MKYKSLKNWYSSSIVRRDFVKRRASQTAILSGLSPSLVPLLVVFASAFFLPLNAFGQVGGSSVAYEQATRRLDVDTKWLRETGVIPAKDQMSVKDFWQIENQSEEKLDKVREPAQKFAQALLH